LRPGSALDHRKAYSAPQTSKMNLREKWQGMTGKGGLEKDKREEKRGVITPYH